MSEIKEKSKQAIEDALLVSIMQDKNSTSRDKEKAFNKIYLRHERALRFFLLKKISDKETVDDLTLVTFEKVHANIDKYISSFAFTTWMYKIATNTLIDHIRKERVDVVSLDTLANVNSEGVAKDFEIKSDSLNPEEILSRKERIKMVQIAIDSLENDFIKELMEHRFIYDMSFEEIAETMGVDNNSTLRVTVRRGKEILKEKLKGINHF